MGVLTADDSQVCHFMDISLGWMKENFPKICSSWIEKEHTHTHTHHLLFLYSCTDGHFGHFHMLVIVNNVKINMEFTLVFDIIILFPFCVYLRRIVESGWSSLFNILRIFHTIFLYSCTSFHFHSVPMFLFLQIFTSICFLLYFW